MNDIASSLVGRAPVFLQALALIERIARYDAPVLIQGETGTGKELAARAIHYGSNRCNGPFVAVNCGAIPDALIESELFGCERGAFTDARQARPGLVSTAEGGTLFLDELDSLMPRAQVSLLRFLQDYGYRAVGGTRELHGNVRVIAAASPRLPRLVATGEFRDDLVFRLGVLVLDMPPLRDRTGDARLLAEHFIARHARQHGVAPRKLHPDSLVWLQAHLWPGNVRELDNLVQRALLLSDDDALQLAPPGFAARAEAVQGGGTGAAGAGAAPGTAVVGFNEARDHALQRFERGYLEALMAAAAGNVTRAARLAGKERRSLGKLLKKHGIDSSVFQA
jgi:DNA-binding NtrC family response regulator